MASASRHESLSDEELLRAYRTSGDSMWLGVLLPRYTMLLLGVAMKYLKDRTLAEDAVQHVFLKCLTNMPREDILNFKGWLYVLMRNHCLQQLRDRQHDLPADLLNYTPVADEVEHMLQKEEHLQYLSESIELLNDEQKTSIELFYLHKWSYEQIMQKTGFTFMQVKSFIQNGKRNLKILIQKKKAGRDE